VKAFINALTVSRLILAFIAPMTDSYTVLLYIAIWAAFSDFLDGYLARTLNQTSPFGAYLDQVADKVFHILLLTQLYFLDQVHGLFLILLILREGLIILFRYLNLSPKSSSALSKWKTALLYLLIVIVCGSNVEPFGRGPVYPMLLISLEAMTIALGFISLYGSVKVKDVEVR
jgi:phosphatidylglycerophosphate synthase